MTGTISSWTNKNSLRDYPFDLNGLDFPNGIIVDAFLCIGSDDVIPCVTALNVRETICSIVFSDSNTGADLFACIKHKSQSNWVNVDSSGNFSVSGHVEFGDTDSAPMGLFRFPLGGVRLLDHCFICLGDDVVTSASVDGLTNKITGHLNLRFSGALKASAYYIQSEMVGSETVFDISLSKPSMFLDLCTPRTTICDCDPKPIKRINSVMPDANGNITIESGNELLTVTTNSSGITVSLEAASNDICPPTNLPHMDGRLIGEGELR
jgi:hypothetical protein